MVDVSSVTFGRVGGFFYSRVWRQMNPACFSLQVDQEGRTVLYVGEVSTSECLAAFPKSEIVELSHFSAELRGVWQSKESVPGRESVGWWIATLVDEALVVVDFSATIGEVGLETHDDGEASFFVATPEKAMILLEHLVGKDSADAVTPYLMDNPGSYISKTNGRVLIYPSFDAYIDRA